MDQQFICMGPFYISKRLVCPKANTQWLRACNEYCVRDLIEYRFMGLKRTQQFILCILNYLMLRIFTHNVYNYYLSV